MTHLLLAAALSFTPAQARAAHEAARGLVEECTPRDPGTYGAYRAARHVRDAASAVGADARLDRFLAATPGGERAFFNVEAEFVASPAAEWIVLVSHFDTKPGSACPGANDGASTTGLLVAFAGELYLRRPRNVNFLLLWTDGEECMRAYGEDDGFWGSRHAAAKLKASGRRVRAVVCLDMLGDADLFVEIPRNATPSLRDLVLAAAADAGLGAKVAASREFVKDDHVAFLNCGFDAVDLIDFNYGSKPGLNDWWHTPHDTMDKVSVDSLLFSGRLLAAVVNRLADDVARRGPLLSVHGDDPHRRHADGLGRRHAAGAEKPVGGKP